jgi:hypothetical protein
VAAGQDRRAVAATEYDAASMGKCGSGSPVNDLFNLIIDPAVLLLTWQRARRTRGALMLLQVPPNQARAQEAPPRFAN